MARKPFHELVAESNTIPWNRNWADDVQPDNRTHLEYIALARTLRIDALLQLRTFLEANPKGVIKDDDPKNPRFYSLTPRDYHGEQTTGIEDLISEIFKNDAIHHRIGNLKAQAAHLIQKPMDPTAFNSDAAALMALTTELNKHRDFVPDNRFLKSIERIVEKAKEYELQRVQHPEKIGDYLRFQILFDNAQDLAAARHDMQFGYILDLAAQKDKLRQPDDISGYRAFMGHIKLERGDGLRIKYEAILSLHQAETYGVDKTFRTSERSSLEMATKMATGQPGLASAFFAAAVVLQKLRKISLFGLYRDIDSMSDMLDPDVDVEGICDVARQSSETNAAACAAILEKLPTVVRLFPDLLATTGQGRMLQ